MKKKNITLLATLALIASLTACGTKTEEATGSNVNESVAESTAESQEVVGSPEAPAQPPTEALISNENDLDAKIAAFEAMMENIANDSASYEQKMQLWEHIFAYCSMTNYEGKTPEEALAQMQEGDDFSKAAALLISAHSDEIQAGFIAEAELWYTDDFDSLYNEFLSCQQTATAKIDTAVKAFTNLSVTDNVLINENGVSLTLDCFDDTTTVYLTLDNNNDSNKKVFFSINDIFVNGINITPKYATLNYIHENGLSFPFIEGLENGNKTQISLSNLNYTLIEEVYNKLGTNYIDSPFETLQIDYQIQIGSNSEVVYDSVVMQTANYNNDSFSTLFGEHFATLEVSNATDSNTSIVETYGKFTDTNCIFAVKSETFENLRISETNNFLINGVELSNAIDYTLYYLPNGALYVVNRSEDELRKQCEIGNDEPLNVILDINHVQYTIFTK